MARSTVADRLRHILDAIARIEAWSRALACAPSAFEVTVSAFQRVRQPFFLLC
jgi:hypothetical protein